jgi:hypothetical protein
MAGEVVVFRRTGVRLDSGEGEIENRKCKISWVFRGYLKGTIAGTWKDLHTAG